MPEIEERLTCGLVPLSLSRAWGLSAAALYPQGAEMAVARLSRINPFTLLVDFWALEADNFSGGSNQMVRTKR